jgi:DNA-binding transcriptional LysR family regulator
LSGHPRLGLEAFLDAELAQGTLVRLLRDWETEPYPLHAVLPSGRFAPNRVRLLVDFLADKFERLISSTG